MDTFWGLLDLFFFVHFFCNVFSSFYSMLILRTLLLRALQMNSFNSLGTHLRHVFCDWVYIICTWIHSFCFSWCSGLQLEFSIKFSYLPFISFLDCYVLLDAHSFGLLFCSILSQPQCMTLPCISRMLLR